jgi:hypothetical protein
VYTTTVALVALMLAGLLSANPTGFAPAASQQPKAPVTLSYEYFKTKVQPIFLTKRPGHARCIACHGQETTPLDLQPLPPGRTTWTEEESRRNFEAVRHVVAPGFANSKLLLHALDEKAGGDFYHNGGKHFASQNDPEWQTLRAWVMGATQ